MTRITAFIFAALVALVSGCTRVETGEVGLRMNFNKTIETVELQPGIHQSMVGNVLIFPVKDITVPMENLTPLTADNTALADFDVTLVYGINPTKVGEIYTQKSRTLHTVYNGETYLLHDYMGVLMRNAAYKEVRKYQSLEVADKREQIEREVIQQVRQQLQNEGYGDAVQITNAIVRNVKPNQQIVQSATEYVKAQNDLKIKTTEVEIARKESERMAALAANSEKSIAFMQAQAELNISEGIKTGKVQTIIVPRSFTSYGVIGK